MSNSMIPDWRAESADLGAHRGFISDDALTEEKNNDSAAV
jgi:hypothetical protein